MMLYSKTDPATLTDQWGEELVDFTVYRTRELLTDALNMEYVDRDDNGEYYHSPSYSARRTLDDFTVVMEEAGIDLTDQQKIETKRSIIYSALEGTVQFVPIVAEFLAAEAVAAAMIGMTMGGSLIGAVGALGRFGSRIGAVLGKRLPGAAGRKKWWEGLHMSKKFKYANGAVLTNKQLKKLAAKMSRQAGVPIVVGSPRFIKMAKEGSGVLKKGKDMWTGGITYSTNWNKAWKHFAFHAMKEELKMKYLWIKKYLKKRVVGRKLF